MSDFQPGERVDDDLHRAAQAAVLRFHGRQACDAPGRAQRVEAARRATDLPAWYATAGVEYVRRVSILRPDLDRRPN